MTVDLEMMLDLRDLQVAMDVAKKAEMGWFDVEFTMYGCSYLQEGKRYYRMSAEAGKIYDFIEAAPRISVFPSNIMTMTLTCPVPMGMKDIIAQDVKKDLAKQLREQYPAAFLDYLAETAALAESDDGLPILLTEQDKVEGCFDQRRLRRFQELVDYTYSCRKITATQYRQMMAWLHEELKSLEDDWVSKDIFEKTFYAIAYETASGIAYFDNAQKATVYRKKYELQQRGILVAPIISETYWYNYTLRLPAVHALFEQVMVQTLDSGYMERLRQISAHNTSLSKEAFAKRLAYVSREFGSCAAQTFRRYGYCWGIK